MNLKYIFSFTFSLFLFCSPFAQQPDKIYQPGIHTVQLFQFGNQSGYPIIELGSTKVTELHFDDLGKEVKSYSYTYQLCNADWQPVDLSTFDYIKGFSQNRINQYRVSSIAKVQYVHYQATLPEANSLPSKSGNYLLKVFLNGDTSQLAFTKRLLVVDNVMNVSAQLLQPYNPQITRTHQKIQFSIDKQKLNIVNPQTQLKVVVLQNYRWDNFITNLQPTFMRGNVYEYSGDNDCIFPAGNEFRWVDLRSFRFQSDRIEKVHQKTDTIQVEVIPDEEKKQERYIFLSDRNGFFEISSTDLINPWWQGDYAQVHFTFIPQQHKAYDSEEVLLLGQLNDYQPEQATKMEYNAEKAVYEKTLLLKQGYYSYTYALKNKATQTITPTDGNYISTENMYTILVYYRSLSGRHDELLNVTTLSSRNFRTDF